MDLVVVFLTLLLEALVHARGFRFGVSKGAVKALTETSFLVIFGLKLVFETSKN